MGEVRLKLMKRWLYQAIEDLGITTQEPQADLQTLLLALVEDFSAVLEASTVEDDGQGGEEVGN